MINKLNAFFFQKRATEGLAVIRILWMSILLVVFLYRLDSAHDFYGPHSLLSLKTLKEISPSLQLNIFHLFGTSYEVTNGILVIYGSSLLCSLLGLFTRSSLIIAFIGMVSLEQRYGLPSGSADLLLRSITFFLIFSSCGSSLSLDALKDYYFKKPKESQKESFWPQRLIQLQTLSALFWFVWGKMQLGFLSGKGDLLFAWLILILFISFISPEKIKQKIKTFYLSVTLMLSKMRRGLYEAAN